MKEAIKFYTKDGKEIILHGNLLESWISLDKHINKLFMVDSAIVRTDAYNRVIAVADVSEALIKLRA